ncbi:MAG: ABC transporter ATP-binding protein, partial [Betaproteobacteria bacterium]|nr:ABC transporter ATP-binding protein [Betaproteobacteria bacterium]
RLCFGAGRVVVTGTRILALSPGDTVWRSWTLRASLRLERRDHAGVASLELLDLKGRLALWRYTLAQQDEAGRLVGVFERQSAPQSTVAFDDRLLDSAALDDALGADEEAQTPPSTWSLLRLGRFARPYRTELALGLLLTLATTAATMVPPYLTMPLMDEVLIPYQNGRPIDPDQVQGYLWGLLAAALLAWVLGWARTWLLARVSERIGADLRTAAFAHLQSLSLEYFGSKRTGDLIARIGNESDRICVFLSLHLLDFTNDVLMILMTAAILVSIDPKLALVTLVPLPFIAWTIHLVRDRLRHGFEKVDRNWGEINNVLTDTIPGIRVVKAFAQENREIARFRAANDRNLAVNDRVNRVWSLFSPTVTLMTELGLLVVWATGIWQVANDRITVGVLAAFLAYIGRFYIRLDSMSRIVSLTQKAAAGAKRIFDILDHVSSVPDPVSPVACGDQKGRLTGHIQIRGIGFRYGHRAVIRGVDLDIAPGQMIGLVGHSGSGKSTLVNLICRFHDVSEGAILVDGVDIRRYALSDYRRNIGLVLQEPFLFFGTIAENIAYGCPQATRTEIVKAARAARAHEFILRLPHGYDSVVGERGQALSGGERQRISIARALLIDPRVLILDEATSSVDTTTEIEIQQALENLIRGRTTIAVAHRLSTLRRADRLVVLDRGVVVEEGGHDELMRRDGAYRKL